MRVVLFESLCFEMSKMNDEAYKREIEAQRARAKALNYLESNGCGPSTFESNASQKGLVHALSEKKHVKKISGDNTLDLIAKQQKNITMASSVDKISTKAALLKQQDDLRLVQSNLGIKESPLPINWEAVLDPSSSEYYYWNRITSETTWTRPVLDSSFVSETDLPPGWVEVVHSGTKQVYYQHQGTSEKRWTKPSLSDDNNAAKSNNSSLKQTESNM